MLIGYCVLLFLSNLFSIINAQTACNLLNLPRECQCQRTRHTSLFFINETYVRCRQLTEITTNHSWSNISYDRLIFETFQDNLTLHQSVFANIFVRTLRFNVQNLILNDYSFQNSYVGQLMISYNDIRGRINFQNNNQIFSGSIITNLYFKFIDFQTIISEIIFSNTRIHTLTIQSSKFYGFTNKKLETIPNTLSKLKYDSFLEYDFSLSTNFKKISYESEHSYPLYLTRYTIISSINTTNLTENYFPNNLDYNQLEEIELSFNQINTLDAHVFRYLKEFHGRLILIHNEIYHIDPYAFVDLYLVKNLSLAKNFIQNLSSIHFENLNELYELDLSFNQIKILNEKTFQYLDNLHILHLNSNPLEFIHSDTFFNLTNLKQINFHGVQFIHLLDQEYYQWIWSLANLHIIHLINTDFDLTDVAFCILSRYNQTLFRLSRQDSCSCSIHYFNRNQYNNENTSLTITEYDTNYLRLTPICNENHIETIMEYNDSNDDLILQNLEDKCNYKLMYLDCDAMTTTTTAIPTDITTLLNQETEFISSSDVSMDLTTEITELRSKPTIFEPTTPNPLNNVRKLFTVLATLLAITIGAILLVFFWYRFKAMLKRRRKKKKYIERQRHFSSSSSSHTRRPSVPRYASVDMFDSIQNTYLLGSNKSQFEALIEPLPSSSLIYKNIDTFGNELIEDFIDDDSLKHTPIGITI